MKRSALRRLLTFAVVVATFAVSAQMAAADTLQDTIVDTGTGVSLVAGSSTAGTAAIFVTGTSGNSNGVQDPDQGCNIDAGESALRLDILTPAGVTATPDPLDITSCDTQFTVSFTASSTAVSGPATVAILSGPAGGGTYLNQVSIPITVTQPTPTAAATSVTVANASAAFDAASVNLNATLTSSSTGVSGKSVNFKIGTTSVGSATTDSSGVASLPLALNKNRDAGTYSFTASFAGDAGYLTSTSAAGTLTVTKANQTITFAQPADRTITSGAFSVAPTATSGLTVAVTSTTTGVCTVSGTQVTLVSTGTCSLAANQAGNTNWNAATQVARSFEITKASQAALTVVAPNSAVFGDVITLTATGGSGTGAVTFAATGGACTLGSGADADKLTITSGTGTCSVTATKAADGTYDSATSAAKAIAISKATQAALTMTSKNTGTYLEAITLTSSGGTGDGAVTYAATGDACAIPTSGPNTGKLVITAGSGTCSVTATKAADDNYAAVSSAAQTITVGKAAQLPLTITSKNTGTYLEAITLTSDGGSGTGAVTYAATGTACTIPDTGDDAGKLVITAGNGSCSVVATKAADGNHSAVSSAAQTVTVSKADQTITFTSPGDKTFGDSPAPLGATASSGLPVSYSSSGTCTAVEGVLLIQGAGSCTVTAQQGGNGNINPAESVSHTITIHKADQAPLVVTTSSDTGSFGALITLGTTGGTGDGLVTFSVGSSTACAIDDTGKLEITSGTGTCSVTATKAGDADHESTTSDAKSVTVTKAAQVALVVTADPDHGAFGDLITIGTTGGSGDGAVSFDLGTSTACEFDGDGKLEITSGTGSCAVTATKASDDDYSSATSAAKTITVSKAAQAALTVTEPDAGTFGDELVPAATGGSGTGGVTFTATGTACEMGEGADTGKLLITSGTGTCAVTAHKAGDTNYDDAASAAHPVTINKATQAALTVTAPDAGTYGQKLTPAATGGDGTGAVTFTASGTACEMGEGADTGKLLITSGTGTCSVTAHKAADDNYSSADSAAHAVSVSRATQATLSVTQPTTGTFGQALALTASGGSGDGAVTFTAAGTACEIPTTGDDAGKLVITSGSGTCSVTAHKAADDNYSSTDSAAQAVTISKAAQGTLTVTQPTTGTFGDVLTPVASGGSGDGAVTFTAAGTACAMGEGADADKLLITSGSGTCSVTAHKAADDDYLAASSDPAAVTVNKATQAALTMTSQNTGSYGDAFSLTSSGGTGTGTTTYAVTGSACTVPLTGPNAGKLEITSGTGTCSVTATKGGGANYLDVSSEPQTITVSKAAQAALSMTSKDNGVYDETITLTSSGGSGTGAVTYSASGTACELAGAGALHITAGSGTCEVKATKAADGNYLSKESAAQTVTVGKADQAALSMTSPSSGNFGDAITLAATGGSGTGSLSFDANGTACAIATSGTNAGKLVITSGTGSCSVTATRAGDGNYLPKTSLAQAITVGKAAQGALSVTPSATSGYLGDTITLSVTGGDGSGALGYSATGPCTVGASTGTVTIGAGGGTCTVTVTKAADLDYNSTSKTVSITAKLWSVGGFYAPIDLGGTPNSAKAGSVIPVKFELWAGAPGTRELKDPQVVDYIKHQSVSCSTLTAAPDEIEVLAAATGATALRFDTTGDQFIYNWKTPSAGCYKLIMMGKDGSSQTAFFSLRK